MSSKPAERFIPASSSDQRSPCPALNTLANHGYLPRNGTRITFTQLRYAIQHVYNLTFALSFLLTLAGFLTSARLSTKLSRPVLLNPLHLNWPLSISWTLNLADLSARGFTKIAHDASLVHPSGVASHAPDPALVENLVETSAPKGLSLRALAAIHAFREDTVALGRRYALDQLHEQIALGECALAWLTLRDDDKNGEGAVIKSKSLATWFGEERLPEEWWERRRPVKSIGLVETRQIADKVGRIARTYYNTFRGEHEERTD